MANSDELQPVSQLDNSFEIYSMGDIQVRKVRLSHQDQFMVLYWLSFNSQHVFNGLFLITQLMKQLRNVLLKDSHGINFKTYFFV